jgi:DNA polymerase III subunit gamma/tau
MSLYHKYRPQTLSEIRGNEEVVSALEGLLSKPEKMPHSFLLHGATGCGKTTIGRIIKNTLEVSDNDYQELNTSDMRGIDTIRDLIKNCQFKPLESSYRIYLVDECHKLTNDAQNAFLKILEDTPSHVIFILCTTEPEKIIKAIRSRCQDFQLKPLSDKVCKRLIQTILRKEQETVDESILDKIVEIAEGHPRNAIQILEKILSTEPEKRAEAAVKTAQETVQSIELCRALIGNSNWTKVREILNGLVGQDAEAVRRQVMGYAQSVLLKSDNEKAGLVLELFKEPFYNSGFPGLVYSCYSIVKNP